MNSKKESILKVKKLEDKCEKLCIKNRELRKEGKYLRRRNKELTASRNDWKDKSKAKSLKNKELKAQIKRGDKMKRHHYPFWIMFLSVQLRMYCGSSYSSISKILEVVNNCFQLKLERLPCANTVQNWVSKLGYYTLKEPPIELKNKAMSLIIDESIRLGKEKLLLILAVDWEKLQTGALKYKDVLVVYMQGSTSWNGKKISKILEQVREKYGMEVKNILSDEDSTLKLSSRLFGVPHLADMAHAMATCLRKTFEKDVDYQSFISMISSFQAKAVNQALSYLRPPKQRVKARFMNLFGVVKWAEKMLWFFPKLNEKEQDFFSQLPSHFSVIMSLKVCILLTQQIGAVFRNFGLCKASLKIIRQLIHQRNYKDKYVAVFIQQVEGYLMKYEKFLNMTPNACVQVSSEIIESMLGKYKAKASYCKLVGLTNLNLELPTYCIDKSELEQYLRVAIQNVFMTDLKTWKQKHSSDNQVVKRIKFFKFGT